MKTATIHCAHSAVWPTEKLVEHPKNPNHHPSEQIRLLAKIIVKHGWRSPIVVSERSGFIVKGHGRLDAARRAGLTEVPVEIQHYKSEAEEIADMVADNRLSELSEMDNDELKVLVAELKADGTDLDVIGFSDDAYTALIGNLGGETRPAERATSRKLGAAVLQYNLVFDSDLQQQQWFAFLKTLRDRYPTLETIAARLSRCITDSVKA